MHIHAYTCSSHPKPPTHSQRYWPCTGPDKANVTFKREQEAPLCETTVSSMEVQGGPGRVQIQNLLTQGATVPEIDIVTHTQLQIV